MKMMTIPAGPAEVTAEWLTDALRSSGVLESAAVTSIKTETIGEGSGFIGQLAKVTLEYDRDEKSAPRTLIAKFPGASDGGRMIGNLFDFYHREIRFYDDIAEDVELRTPKRYFSAANRETQEYILLIEDMEPMLIGDHASGCTLAEAEMAIQRIAKFHATWWEHPRLEVIAEWMPQVDGEVHRSAEPAYQQSFPAFLEMFGKGISPEMRDILERIGQNVVKLQSSVSDRPHTIVHGDFRTDNLFFRGPGGGDDFAVVDWQISCRGRGVFDIAYLLCGGLEADVRKANEERLLKLYHDTLVANGVKGYSFEQCWREYRRMALYVMVYVVIAVGTLDAANERGMALWTAWLRRALASIDELNAIEEIPV